MFTSSGNEKKYEDVTDDMSAVAHLLADDLGPKQDTPLKEHLDADKLDFSLESLRMVDSYLDQVRAHRKDLTEDQLVKVIARCGAYCGEVIRKNFEKDFYWITYDTAVAIDPRLKSFEKSLYSSYILFAGTFDFSFPLSKVGKYLANGPEDSLYFFAKVVGDHKQK